MPSSTLNSKSSPRGFFPLFIPVSGKQALIIGGGNIALRRLKTLLQFDCSAHIIAAEVNEELEKTAAGHSGIVSIERRPFRTGDISGTKGEPPFLVVAATNKREINRAVAEECAALNIPVSVADCKEESTFYFPAIAIHGKIIAGISSGGADHGAVRDAAKKIREVLNEDTNRNP
ncbi:MAG: NAD(P)-dependent oxidoreductase [Spirochaetaceae bacterium]|jgi:siroheme synthase-like protein|nr:NAD(P)-dependent oxidoreductase [Spirochaetaceae bacterium]